MEQDISELRKQLQHESFFLKKKKKRKEKKNKNKNMQLKTVIDVLGQQEHRLGLDKFVHVEPKQPLVRFHYGIDFEFSIFFFLIFLLLLLPLNSICDSIQHRNHHYNISSIPSVFLSISFSFSFSLYLCLNYLMRQLFANTTLALSAHAPPLARRAHATSFKIRFDFLCSY
jgi:hypothetical protein